MQQLAAAQLELTTNPDHNIGRRWRILADPPWLRAHVSDGPGQSGRTLQARGQGLPTTRAPYSR